MTTPLEREGVEVMTTGINNRIRIAFKRGYASGRYWQRRQVSVVPTDYKSLNPYTTYMPGVQCHIAWIIGFHLAFQNVGKAEARDWSARRRLYAI